MTNANTPLERLSQGVRTALALARDEATTYRQAVIGTEHLLLGLIRTPNTFAAQVLAGLDVTLERAREAVELTSGYGR